MLTKADVWCKASHASTNTGLLALVTSIDEIKGNENKDEEDDKNNASLRYERVLYRGTVGVCDGVIKIYEFPISLQNTDVIDEIRVADTSVNCACLFKTYSRITKSSRFVDLGYKFEQGVAKLVPPINLLFQTNALLTIYVPVLAAETKVSVELVCGLVDDGHRRNLRRNLARHFRQLYPNGKQLHYRSYGIDCD